MAPFRPPGSSPIHRCGDIGVVVGWGVETKDLEEIEQNLEGLTMDIPDITVDDLPWHYQHHTIGFLTSIGRLLHRVAWAGVCYHEKHPWCIIVWSHVLQHFGLRTHTFCNFWRYNIKLLPTYLSFKCVFGFINGANVYLKHNWLMHTLMCLDI